MQVSTPDIYKLLAASLLFVTFTNHCGAADPNAVDPLSAWNDTAPKKTIVEFVEKVTREGSPDFVPVAQRIAVFDNDGTLWSEQPVYVQAFFLVDRIRQLASQHPQWKAEEPFASVLKGDFKSVLHDGGKEGLIKLLMASHAGVTTDEFAAAVNDWISTAKHPQTGRRFVDMTYLPMRQLLAYLRDHGFKTYIVSGGGIEFMRPWAEQVYGVPAEQVIGSSIKTRYEVRDGVPVLVREPELNFIDDKEGKPVGIQQHIGRRPIMAFGNSDGDFQMLQWTTSGPGPRFGLIVHHDDADREFAYDRDSKVGKLAQGLDEGPQLGWTIVSIKNDWNSVFGDGK
jgi:phosphoserine phosphatase